MGGGERKDREKKEYSRRLTMKMLATHAGQEEALHRDALPDMTVRYFQRLKEVSYAAKIAHTTSTC